MLEYFRSDFLTFEVRAGWAVLRCAALCCAALCCVVRVTHTDCARAQTDRARAKHGAAERSSSRTGREERGAGGLLSRIGRVRLRVRPTPQVWGEPDAIAEGLVFEPPKSAAAKAAANPFDGVALPPEVRARC